MICHPRFTRFCLIGILVLITAPSAALAEKTQTWRRLRSPNFIVVTNASEKQARRVAYQFELIRAIFRQVFNIQGTAPDPPVIIIAAKDEATLMPLLPQSYLAKGAMHPAGLYVGGPEKNYVALRLDVSLNQEAYEPFEPVYHEYVHYLMRRSISQLPLWLTEGLAEFYGNIRLEGKIALVGAPSSSNLIVLRQEQLLPLSTLFGINASSPYYHENNKASIFYAESWALTHYLMIRDWREHTHRLSQFVGSLGQNAAPERVAKSTIGDPRSLEEELRMYIGHFSFSAVRFPVSSDVDEDTFTPEPMSDAESLVVRADFLVHSRRYTEARQMLEESLKSDPKLAAGYESMGLLYAEQNQPEEANKWYSQAVALNSQSYLANFYYASNLLKGKLDDNLAAHAEASLRAAIRINPGFAPSYAALAYLLTIRHRGLEEARMLTLQAVSLEPGNVHYRLQMATLLEQMDRVDDALRVASLAVSMAKTPEEQTVAQSTLDNLRQFQEYKQRLQERQEAFKKAQEEASGRTGGELAEGPARLASGEAASVDANSSPEETQPPELRHRDEITATGPGDQAPSAQGTLTRLRPELLTQRKLADGTITDSKCSGDATIELTVLSPAGIFKLYNDNYFKIPYKALNYTPQGILNPCVDMKGMRAHITYYPAKNHPEVGEIVAVELVK